MTSRPLDISTFFYIDICFSSADSVAVPRVRYPLHGAFYGYFVSFARFLVVCAPLLIFALPTPIPEKSLPHPPTPFCVGLLRYLLSPRTLKNIYPDPHPIEIEGGIPQKYITHKLYKLYASGVIEKYSFDVKWVVIYSCYGKENI